MRKDKNMSAANGKKLLIVMMSALVAVALGLTSMLFVNTGSSRSSVENVDQGEAMTSASASLSTAGSYSYTGAGALAAGDVISMAYCGGEYAITLPTGTYTLSVVGAAGGKSNHGIAGGKGGNATGTLTLTSSRTIYVNVGGQGGTQLGGYNGGGNGGSANNDSAGGGGCTSMSYQSGQLKNTSQSNCIIVAGGGGASGCSNTYGGDGGGTNGGAPYKSDGSADSYGAGTPATSSGPGTSGTNSTAPGFGYGGNSGTSQSWPGGGGGGGYWGGGAGANMSGGGGAAGGGCGYIGGVSGGTFGTASNTTNGSASITVVSVNKAPTTKSPMGSVTTKKRGESGTASIAVTSIATDSDSGQTVYFSTGSGTSYPTAANSELYTSAGSGLSTVQKYITWTWTGNTTLNITSALKYPRNGVDGVTQDGRLLLYTRVRDSFSTPAYAWVSFYVYIPVNTVSYQATADMGSYIRGSSNTTTVPAEGNVTTSNIYNPVGTGRYTVIAKAPLRKNASFTFNAADLLTGIVSYDQAYMALPSTTTDFASSNASRVYKINEYDSSSSPTKETIYNTAKTAITGYTQLTVTILNPSIAYKYFTVTLYVVEKVSANSSMPRWVPGISTYTVDVVFRTENTRPVLKAGVDNLCELRVGETKTLSLNSYFSDVDDPTISASTHIISGVTVPANEFRQVNIHGELVSVNSPNNNNYNIGANASNTATSGVGTTATGFHSSIAYNATAGGSDTSAQAFMRFTYSNDTISVSGLKPSFTQYSSSRTNPKGHFYLLLHITDKRHTADTGIWLPIAFRIGYGDANNNSPTETASSTYPTVSGAPETVGYLAPGAINVGNRNVLLGGRLNDEGTGITTDGIQFFAADADNFSVGSAEADTLGLPTVRSGKLNEFVRFSDATTPSSIVSGVSEAGLTVSADGLTAENKFLKVEQIDIYVLSSYFATAEYAGGRVVVGAGSNTDKGFMHITMADRTVGGRSYFITKGFKVTLKSSTMNRYFYSTVEVQDAGGKKLSGLKVAFRVNNTAPTAERTGGNVATYGRTKIGEDGEPFFIDDAHSTYEYDPDNADPAKRVTTPTFTVRLPLNGKVVITPYDFVSDFNMQRMYGSSALTVAGGFTFNGMSARYDPATGTLSTSAAASASNVAFEGLFDRTKYGISSADSTYKANVTNFMALLSRTTSVKGVAASNAVGTAPAANPNVYNDRLFFARTGAVGDAYTYNPTSFNDFAVSISNASGFVSAAYGTNVQIGSTSYGVDYIMLTGLSRTVQPAYFDLTVRDRFGDSADGAASFVVRIAIEVVNTKPLIKDDARYETIAVVPLQNDGRIEPTTAIFASDGNADGTGLMTDADGDTPAFITARGILLANTPELVALYADDNMISSFDEVPLRYRTENGRDDGRPLENFVDATIVTQYEMSVSALSPTKNIEKGVYVYFFVGDGHGGISLGYVRVEVVNSTPTLNTDEVTGFDPIDPLWKIEVTSAADITRNRYIVGSRDAYDSLVASGEYESDVRMIATDPDALQNKTILSPVSVDRSGGSPVISYVNLVKSDGSPADADTVADASALEKSVPDIVIGKDFTTSTGAKAAAAVICLGQETMEKGRVVVTALDPESVPENYAAQIKYLYNGRWVVRDDLITALTGKALSDPAMAPYFDEHGRWICTDWAVDLRAAEGLTAGTRIIVKLAVRDEVYNGGDTAGIETAYNSDRSRGMANVNGLFMPTVYEFISKTGIRTKDEYEDKYNGYYTVEFSKTGERSPIVYVPTYDGKTDSVYSEDDFKDGDSAYNKTIAYKISGSGENEVHALSFDGSGTAIKTRTAGAADNSKAGPNSGTKYNARTIDDVAGAYHYPDTVIVPDGGKNVYVPMSFFGLLENIVSSKPTGEVIYPDEYVGYNIPSGGYSRDNLNTFRNAITLSDGNRIWTGAELNKNPYITIDAFDEWDAATKTGSAAEYYADEISKPYFNNTLSVLTVNEDDILTSDFHLWEANKNNFVGDGRLMYLADQAEKLQEHNFGLVITKNAMRTGVRNLTLTIDLAKSKGNDIAVGDVATDTRTVSVNIRVEDAKLDLHTDGEVLKYQEPDAASGKKGTYYVDLTMPSGTQRTFELVRYDADTDRTESTTSTAADTKSIAYTDGDFMTAEDGTNYRDRAYFHMDSLSMLSRWERTPSGVSRYLRPMSQSEDKSAMTNVNPSDEAQNSVRNYFASDVRPNSGAAIEDLDGDYQPNGGIYGSNVVTGGAEGYSSYFSASLGESGRAINIMSSRKTFINKVALTGIDGVAGAADKPGLLGSKPITQENVKAIYKERGLVAEYASDSADPLEPTRVYYPLRVLIYDNCGAGWDDAAYVAVEFRIQITNGDPSLKKVGSEVTDASGKVTGREYTLNLAVGNSVSINIYDLVSDGDMYVMGQSNYSLATKDLFFRYAPAFDFETGDYLDSPFAHDVYLKNEDGSPSSETYDKNNIQSYTAEDGKTKYYRNGGGFSLAKSTDNDVIMWMETPLSISELNKGITPSSNTISFTVNRRTTASVIVNGESKNVAVNEYRFSLRFYDSAAVTPTGTFTFIINITNQTPTVAPEERNITMRSGDEFTLLTTYYDAFSGEPKNSSFKNKAAYDNSLTKTYYEAHIAKPGYAEGTTGDGTTVGSSGYWKYADITSDEEGEDFVFDSTVDRASSKAMHLGFLGLGNDDTPWRLRIADYSYDKASARIWVDDPMFTLRAESDTDSSALPMALTVRAVAACEKEPMTITLSDGEGGTVTFTLYITIVSSPPVARDCDVAADNTAVAAAGLEGETEDGKYKSGYFRLFTVPQGEAYCTVDGFTGVKHAKSSYTIGMSNVARDPDGNSHTVNLKLYDEGMFALNGEPLVRKGSGFYSTDYFDITILNNGREFLLTAKDYNPDTSTGYEELSFRVQDYGVGDYENSLEIVLRIYTLYSDMQNTSVASMSPSAYKDYLAGANKVHVKSYDRYYGTSGMPEQSKYAHMSFPGNTGNDGNDASPVNDPDVNELGKKNYTTRLYALMVQEGSNYRAMNEEELSELFVRNGTAGTFGLKDPSKLNNYMIGGIDYTGLPLTPSQSASALASAVNRHATFAFADDGTSVSFKPVASTFGAGNYLLYIESEKAMTRTSCLRSDGMLAAGSLFVLDVEDSAPIANLDDSVAEDAGYNFEAEGYAGESVTFKVFDRADRFNALFTDSDNGDLVSVEPFAEGDYIKALEDALEADPDLDWAAGEGKQRAFNVVIDSEAQTLTIEINRRMDKIVNTVYQGSVTFPIRFVGTDLGGKSAETVIMLTVKNRDATARDDIYSVIDPRTQTGYSYKRREAEPGSGELVRDNEYQLDVRIRYSAPIEISIFDFMIDPDYDEEYDSDSFMFVEGRSRYPLEYLTNEPADVEYIPENEDESRKLATIEPLGKDKYHRTGFRISATDTTRSLTATILVRIIDRSGDTRYSDGSAALDEKGIYLQINVSVINDAPYVKEGMESTKVTMFGSDAGTPGSKLFFIGDFVADRNESDVTGDTASYYSPTYLRIFTQSYLGVSDIYSTIYEKIPDRDEHDNAVFSSSLFELTCPSQIPDDLLKARAAEREALGLPPENKDGTNKYNQWFILTPKRGFYGEGAVEITVIDGDLARDDQTDSLTTVFRIDVNVIYNAAEMSDELKEMPIPCSQTRLIDAAGLMTPLVNKLDLAGSGVLTSAMGDSSFDQSMYYELSKVELQNESDKSYATVTRVGDTTTWSLQAGKLITLDPIRVNVEYVLKSDPTVKYQKFFKLSVIKNDEPYGLFPEITFVRYDRKGDDLTDLDDSNTIRLEAYKVIGDTDSDPSALKFVSAKSQIPSLVKVSLSEDKRYLVINFVARGESEISVEVADETGDPVLVTFKAINNDLPKGSFWLQFVASFEANKVLWVIIICSVLLLLILLIIFITVHRKRKRAREELEALLVSEMELEEQMLKLAGGPSPTGYESFGYLPTGGESAPDPGMMLGAGESAPADAPIGLSAPSQDAQPPQDPPPPDDGQQ